LKLPKNSSPALEDQDVLSLRSWLQKLRGAQADPNFRFTSLPPGQRTLERLLLELQVFEQKPTRLSLVDPWIS
jgi:hypothetical protein